jgi:hemolysin III
MSTTAAQARPQLRGWFDLVAAFVAIALAPLVIALAPDGTRALAAVHAFGVVAVLGVSGFYHRVFWSTQLRSFMRSLDHSMIFIFIAVTYTPVSVATLDGKALGAILGVVWGGAVVGITMRLSWPQAPTWLVAVPYVVVGWAIIPVLDRVLNGLGPGGFGLLMTGGALYMLGAAVYALRRTDPTRGRAGSGSTRSSTSSSSQRSPATTWRSPCSRCPSRARSGGPGAPGSRLRARVPCGRG